MTELSHFDDHGSARMVNVGGKSETFRTAVASGIIKMNLETMNLIRDHGIGKGNVLELRECQESWPAKRQPN